MAPLLRLEGLAKAYGALQAVHPVNLEVEAGEVCAILGPSGCGKSTLLRMIAGFARPSAGRVLIERRDVTGLGPERRPTNTVFQSYGLFPHLNVAENVAFGLRLARRPEEEVRRRVGDALALVRLDGFDARAVSGLSGGQQQRVALARALVMRPKVLLLDEPLAALDLKLRQAMQAELRRIHREIGGTFLFVTHDQGEAFHLAQRVVVMCQGRVEQTGTPTALRFAADGALVALLGRTAEPLAEVEGAIRAAGGVAITHVCDVAEMPVVEAALAAVLAQTGRIDVLVNNAGVSGVEAPFLELSTEAWDRIFAVNLRAPFLISRWVARHMVERGGGGVILHNASIAALATDGPFAHYSAAKAGLLALTRSMAVELAPHRIRVNAVSPGYTRTEMTTQFFDPATIDHLTRDFARGPLRRLVEPAEVAAAFAWLASDEASGTTGANLVVDGGLTANLYILESLPTA